MSKICLSPSLSCGFLQENILSFGFGSIQKIISEQDDILSVLKLAAFLKTPKSFEEIEIYIEQECLHSAYVFLQENKGLLIQEAVAESDSRYHRQLLYFNMQGLDAIAAQDKLRNAHVVIIGCGGIGTQISCALATAGVGHLTLIDNDTIELTNLNRQFLFDEQDLGLQKTKVLKQRLVERNREIQVDLLPLGITSAEDFTKIPRADLIVLSADTPASLIDWCNHFAVAYQVPFINVGYVQDIAIIGPFVIPGQTGCVACTQFFAETDHVDKACDAWVKQINSQYQAPSIGPINMIASGMAALEIINYLSGLPDLLTVNRRIGYWTNTGLFQYQHCPRREDCPACSPLFVE